MDRFLYATNPLNPAGPQGLQGYIIDTTTGTWLALTFIYVDKEQSHLGTFKIENPYWVHQLTIAKSSGDDKTDQHTTVRAARWYDAWLQQQGVEVEVHVNWSKP